MPRHMIAALYQFVPLPDYRDLRAQLDRLCRQRRIKGTLLLAEEGINGTISGTEEDLRFVLATLRSDARLAGLTHKESWSDKPPFVRLKVRLKKEIVTLGVPGVDPTTKVGTYVKPRDWNALISQPDVILIDARNAYEVRLGSFEGAVDPSTESFREFPAWVEAEERLGAKPRVAMFCTGGIRCEKASSYMLNEGFEEVYHLEGGILQYLADVPQEESMWRGECYVFDRRVSVDHELAPGSYQACRACGLPLTDEDKDNPLFIHGVACAYCHDQTSDERKERFAERQHQINLAAERGEDYLGVRQRKHRSSEVP